MTSISGYDPLIGMIKSIRVDGRSFSREANCGKYYASYQSCQNTVANDPQPRSAPNLKVPETV